HTNILFLLASPASTEIYTLSLHDALPILQRLIGLPAQFAEALSMREPVPFRGQGVFLACPHVRLLEFPLLKPEQLFAVAAVRRRPHRLVQLPLLHPTLFVLVRILAPQLPEMSE